MNQCHSVYAVLHFCLECLHLDVQACVDVGFPEASKPFYRFAAMLDRKGACLSEEVLVRLELKGDEHVELSAVQSKLQF